MVTTFPKRLHLREAADFKKVFQARKKHGAHGFSLYVNANGLLYPRLGLVVAKKAVRKAVVRNRIKRIIRESFRYNQQKLDGKDIVVIVYPNILTLQNSELRQQIDRQWLKIISCSTV